MDHHRVDRPSTAKPAIDTSGTFAGPPPHAPTHERNQPLTPELVADQLEKAQANEQTLAPLDFSGAKGNPGKPAAATLAKTKGKPGPVVPIAPIAPTTKTEALSSAAAALADSLAARGVEVPARYPISPLSAPAPEPHPGPTGPDLTASTPGPDPSVLLPRHAHPDREPYRPAASDTDGPSRGLPQPIGDPNKQIVGGFGAEPGQYFALDGSEISAIVKRLLGKLHRQLDADLRFGLAICYPQVRVQVSIRLDGAVSSAGVNDMAFSLSEAEILVLEALIEDDQTTPPDAHRLEADLERPFKRVILTGAGRQFADRDMSRA